MMRAIVAWIVGLGLVANGLTMLAVPDAWYGLVPGVPQTGPFNPHFVRDIGAAYLVAGASLAVSRSIEPRGRPRLPAPPSSPSTHWFTFGMRRRDASTSISCSSICRQSFCRLRSRSGSRGRRDILSKRRRSKMLKWFLSRWITKFERTWNYDASYLRDVLDADPRAMMAFSRVTAFGQYHKDVPLAVFCAAGIVGAMREDCGPCTQLGIDMAQRNGVDPAVLRAIVARDINAMPFEVALAVRFAEASLDHAPEADDLREEVLRRFGKRGLVSLAFVMTASRLYPTLKYALGHGRACTRLTVGGETRPVLRQLTKAA
jgi:hypothetical protein